MGLGLRTMEQRITAGNDFDGTLPTTTLARADGIEFFPPDAVGGLFDFKLEAPVMVRTVELVFDGNTTIWTVHKRDRDGDELLYLCGTDETDFIATVSDSIVLTDKQLLIVRCTGATGALIARVTIQAPV